jgi:ribosomal protein S18 acetylase RimI-like enzyme
MGARHAIVPPGRAGPADVGTAEAKIRRRPVTPEDEPFLCAVYGSTRVEELAQVDWDEEQKLAFVQMQFAAQHRYYQEHYADASFQVILCDGVPAGRLYVARWPAEIRIVDIALLPEYRGRGIGTHLLHALQAEAALAGKPLRIHVERFNPALRLYDRLGFREIADRGVYLFLEWTPDVQPIGAEPAAPAT